MGLREQFQALLKAHGRMVYLAIQTGARCLCFKQPSKEADPACPYCLGTGRMVRLHRVLAYARGAAMYPSQPNSHVVQDTGEHAMSSRVYYLDASPKVSSGDLLIEPIRTAGKLTGIEAVYRLASPYYYHMEDGGRPAQHIYTRAGAVLLPSHKDPVFQALKTRFRKGIRI